MRDNNSGVRLVLASASPRRRALLQQIGLRFETLPADCDETVNGGDAPSSVVMDLAAIKARTVAQRVRSGTVPGFEPATPSTPWLIIGADTIVVLDGQILGKPRDAAHARQMLETLSGRTHEVYTGVALLYLNEKDEELVFYERTHVRFGQLDALEIEAYVAGGSPMDKAGAYGIQDDMGALFVRAIDGDYYNVVGFPLYRFYREVNKCWPGLVTVFDV